MIKLQDPLRDATIKDLISWLEGQDPKTKYVYHNSSECLLCGFLKAHGVESPGVNPFQWHAGDGNMVCLPPGFNSISLGNDDKVDWTYGAALERARAFEATGTFPRSKFQDDTDVACSIF